MPWTNNDKIKYLLRAPWTINVGQDDGDITIRVTELPSVLGVGPDAAAAERDFWESLRESVRCYVHFEDPIPYPPQFTKWPWEEPPVKPAPVNEGPPVLSPQNRSDASPRVLAVVELVAA